MSTKVLDYSGNGDYANHAAANAALASGACTTLLVRRLSSVPSGFKADDWLYAGTQDGVTIDSEDGALVDLMLFHSLIGATWTNYSGNIWYTELGTTDQKNCRVIIPDDAWSAGYGVSNFTYLEPLLGASIAAVAASLTNGKSWIDNTTGRLYVNIGGDPSSSTIYRTINFGNQTSYNGCMGLVTGTGANHIVRNIRAGGVGLFDPSKASAAAAVASMGAWAFGGPAGDGLVVENCEAWHGSNHTAGWTNIAAGATVTIDLRVEQMMPSSTSGVCVFTTGGGAGSTVNLTLRCDKGIAVYGSPDGAVIAPGGGSALLIHDGGYDFAAFNLLNSTLTGGQFQVNDNNGPITATGSDLLDVGLGSVAPITSGFTATGCILRKGIPNYVDGCVVSLRGCTIYPYVTREMSSTLVIEECTIDAADVFGTGSYNMHTLLNGLANTTFRLTFNRNTIIADTTEDYTFLNALRLDNIVSWNRNRWQGALAPGVITTLDTNNDGVSNGLFRCGERATSSAMAWQGQGLDADPYQPTYCRGGVRARRIQPASILACYDMAETSGRMIRDLSAALKHVYLGNGTATRNQAGPEFDAISTAFNATGRHDRAEAFIAGPSGGQWNWTWAGWLKATAGAVNGSWIWAQGDAGSRRIALLTGYEGSSQNRNKLCLGVNDGSWRSGISAGDDISTFADGTWHYHTIVVSTSSTNKSRTTWYRDGVLIGQGPEFAHPASTTWTRFSLGTEVGATGAGFVGSMAGPQCFWSAALTATEVLRLSTEMRKLRRLRYG